LSTRGSPCESRTRMVGAKGLGVSRGARGGERERVGES